MNDIEYVELGSICEVVRGGSPRPIIDFITEDDDGVNWLKIGDVSEFDKYFTYAKERIKPSGIPKTREVRKGDLILSNSMSFGRAFITLIDGYIHDGWLRLRCDDSKIDKEYLYYFLTSSIAQNQFKAVATGSVVNNLKSDTVKAAKIALPSLQVQKKIASILSILDDKIVANGAINRNLAEQIQLLYSDYFESEESENWAPVPLIDLIFFQEGPGIRNWQYVEEDGTKFINIRCISNGDIDVTTANMISNGEAEGKYAHFMLKPYDIVMSCSGTLGRYAIVREEHLPLCLNTSVIRFSPAVVDTDFSYVYGYMTSREFLNRQREMACGSVQANFGPTHLKKIEIHEPPIELRRRYHEVVFPFIQQMICLRRENDRLVKTRDSLLPKLMSGKLDISDLDL